MRTGGNSPSPPDGESDPADDAGEPRGWLGTHSTVYRNEAGSSASAF
jgi:hypothetical protein